MSIYNGDVNPSYLLVRADLKCTERQTRKVGFICTLNCEKAKLLADPESSIPVSAHPRRLRR